MNKSFAVVNTAKVASKLTIAAVNSVSLNTAPAAPAAADNVITIAFLR